MIDANDPWAQGGHRDTSIRLLRLLLAIVLLLHQLLCGPPSLASLPPARDHRLGLKVSEQVFADVLDRPAADKVDDHRRSQTEFELLGVSREVRSG